MSNFLTRDEILRIHGDMLLEYGGTPGIRDEGLLDSALAMPQAGFGNVYLHPDPASMAAAYLFHLVKNHPFVDGNKRVGSAAAFVFLDTNGLELVAAEEDFEALVFRVANGAATKDDVAEFIRLHLVSRS